MQFLMTDDGPRRRRGRPGFEGTFVYNTNTSDIKSLIRGELTTLRSILRNAKNGNINRITKYHYQDVIARIDALLDPK